MSRETGDILTKSFLSYVLADLVTSFNISKTLSQQQLVDTVEAIIKDFYYIKPTELKYCFEKAKKGAYGIVYDRIDQSIIYQWIETYLIERSNTVIETNQNDKIEHQKRFDNIILPILKSINLEELEKPKKVKTPEKLPHHDFYQKCMRSFDLIRIKFGDSSGRYIKRFGNMINIEQFVEIKAEQLIRVTAMLEERNKDLL